MSELEDRLRQLAQEAQEKQGLSRKIVLDRLFREIQQSGQLGHYWSLCPRQLHSCYEDIYAEALQNLFRYLTEKIDRYNPASGEVLQWANGLLRWRFLDAVRDWHKLPPSQTQQIVLEDLDKIKDTELNPSLSEKIIQVIKEDPEHRFVNKHMRNNPKANFKVIALRRMEGYSWQEISEELNCKISALSNFYQRSLKEFKVIIQNYLA